MDHVLEILESPECLRVPNGVFQTVFFGLLTSAWDRGKSLQRDEECLKTPVFSSILVPSAVAGTKLKGGAFSVWGWSVGRWQV